jgi:hypothetical protein
MWWFWESHVEKPKVRIIRVYSFREYFTASGHHIYVENYQLWRTLYRAVGMVLPWLKRFWDRGEARIWPVKGEPMF